MHKRKKKYIPCSGLAFLGEEDMEMLHAYALEGWIFREFSFLCYVLYKEKPQDLIFSYDLTKVKKSDQDEYLQMFTECGWQRIFCRSSSTWFFSAPSSAIAVHTDQATLDEEYHKVGNIAKYVLIIGLLETLISYLLLSKHAFFHFTFRIGMGFCLAMGLLILATTFRNQRKRLLIMAWSFRRSALILSLSIVGIFLCGMYMQHVLIRLLYIACFAIAVASLVSLLWHYPLYRDGKERYLCQTMTRKKGEKL